MKKLLIIILFIIGLLIIVPLLINYGISDGLFGVKPFTTIFNNELWFEFWYNYLPAIIAFAGTIYAVMQSNRQNERLHEFEEKNFAFSVMPELKCVIDESNYKVINVVGNFKEYRTKMDMYFIEQNTLIKKKLRELVDLLENANNSNYKKIIDILNDQLLLEKINFQFNYLYNTGYQNIIREQVIKDKWNEVTLVLTDTNTEFKKFIDFNLLYKEMTGELPKVRTNVEGMVIITADDKGIKPDITEFYYYMFRVRMLNYSKSDIISIRINSIDILINHKDKLHFNINEEKSIVVHQNRKEESDKHISLNVYLYNESIMFEEDMDIIITMNYEIVTALKYRYSCMSIFTYSKNSKSFNKTSYANLKPIG